MTLQQFMLPEHANPYGNVHGGVIVRMIDETGAIAAMRHAQSACVTVAIDSMTFLWPVHVGELLCCSATVTWVGETSIEVEVRVHAENPMTGSVTHTNSAYLVYVAVDEHGHKRRVPPLRLENREDRARHRDALRRRGLRLASRTG